MENAKKIQFTCLQLAVMNVLFFSSIALIFGLAIVVGGIFGVLSGGLLSARLKQTFQRSDPIICGISLNITTAFFIFAMYLASYSTTTSLVLIFLGVIFANCIWSINDDMLLYVTPPIRRNSAIAFRIGIGCLGEGGSAYILGKVR